MSRRANILAIFERQAQPLDFLAGEKPKWCEVTKAFISLEPLTGKEQLLAQQLQSHTTHKTSTIWTPTLSAIDSTCRMKIAKPVPVDAGDPTSDKNFRIFQIESLMNVREQNRELQMMIVEQ